MRSLSLHFGVVPWLGWVAVWSLGGSVGVAADDFEAFQRARAAYTAGDYETAARRFERLVGGEVPRLDDPGLLIESRKLLGAAYLFLGQRERAERQFERLLRAEPDYPLDPVQFPQEVRVTFEAVRRRVRESLRAEAEARERERRRRIERLRAARESERARWRRLQALASIEWVEEHRSVWPLWIPFGVGQFHNGERTLGYVLLSVEGALALGSVGTWLGHTLLRDAARQGPQSASLADGLRLANWLLTGLFLVVASGGVAQALVAHEPIRHRRRRRELPESLRAPPRLDALCGRDVSDPSEGGGGAPSGSDSRALAGSSAETPERP